MVIYYSTLPRLDYLQISLNCLHSKSLENKYYGDNDKNLGHIFIVQFFYFQRLNQISCAIEFDLDSDFLFLKIYFLPNHI